MAQTTSSNPANTSSQESSGTETDKKLKNKPNDSKLRQQKLPAWQPILTAFTAIPTVFLIAIIFIPIGIVLLLAAELVSEKVISYDNCQLGQRCTVEFQLQEDFEGDVYFYYALENYFQNHRRYVKSRSDQQLAWLAPTDVSDCSPYDKLDGKPVLPCGAIANSMFNDTFAVYSKGTQVEWTYEGVVWDVDKQKYKNPQGVDLCTAFSNFARPQNWQKDLCHLDDEHPDNNGLQNVDFIVWMRTAALPSFRKLYRILKRDQLGFQHGMPKGNYTLIIQNNYNVADFNGKKSFVISTTSWAGGKNKFLGIAYIVIGSMCLVLGCVFTFIHLKFGHSFAEMADVTAGVRT
ncbi:unnamed protein product [Bursaphelenchus okinawaensis]|uniref:Cell cycle control protein 50A n=1 Tax=Bursaphelenchus okinawaensis TaxID=465554 RepID=A0A811KTL3_9BILA|nr:unnamed protein product [Bursaphelenchus okinawaensis]CAG9111235.1 unnamed protein product [Bursaphelenchus okinawaensis]